MKSTSVSLGWRHVITDKVRKREIRLSEKVERDALCYDAHSNKYSIASKSVPPNLFYSMELGARALIEVWPFFNNRLLDIGCGKKPYELLIDSLVKRYIGLDISNKSDNQIDILANGLYIPFKRDSYDTVLSMDVLNELSSPIQLFYEVNRILRSDGYFITLISNHYNIFEKNMIYSHLTAEGLRNLAERSGFNIVVMRSKGRWIPFFYNLIVQLLYRLREKYARYWDPNLEISETSFKRFNCMILQIQKFLLKITPASSIKTNVEWEKSQKKQVIRGSFHLGYLMVAKKVFDVDL